MATLISAPSMLPEPSIEADGVLQRDLCDIRSIFADTFATAGRPPPIRILARMRIVVTRSAERTWSFRVFLRTRELAQARPWHLRAETCRRTAYRTALKLVLATGSLPAHPVVVPRSLPSPRVEEAIEPLTAEPPIEKPAEPPIVPLPTQRPEDTSPPEPASADWVVPLPPEVNPPAAPPAAKTRAATPAPIRTMVVYRQASTRRRFPVGVRVRWSVRAGRGVLPQPTFGGGLVHAALVVGRARLELGATISGAGPLGISPERTHRPIHTGLQVNACGEFTRRAVDARLCLGAEGGLIVMRIDTDRQRPWTLHAIASPSVTWWFHRHLGLYAGVTAGPAIVRSDFYYGPGPGEEAIAERSTPPYLVAGSAGLELRLPTSMEEGRR